MTLEEISYIGEIIAAVAVIASLIFVGTQLRQNTRAMRITAGQAMVTTWAATSRDVFNNDDLLRDVTRSVTGADGLDDMAGIRANFWFGNALRQGEFNYFNWKSGDLDERYWRQTDGALAIGLSSELGRGAWERLKPLHSAEFAAIMDKHVAAGLKAADAEAASSPADTQAEK
ncbi:MAG: hypothetical protein ACE363_02170 [Alphaproteobacteria bacterium]